MRADGGSAVYVNSYLGSLNARGVLLARQDDALNVWSPPANGRGIALSVRHSMGGESSAAREAAKRPPVVHVERSIVYSAESGLPSAKDDNGLGRSQDPSIVDLGHAPSKVCACPVRAARRADLACHAQGHHFLSYTEQ
jgi:hypothetical protein